METGTQTNKESTPPVDQDVLIDAAVNHWLKNHLADPGSDYVAAVTDEIVVCRKKRELFGVGAYMAANLSACQALSPEERGHFCAYVSLAHREAGLLREEAAGPFGWWNEARITALSVRRSAHVDELAELSAKMTANPVLAQMTKAGIEKAAALVRTTAADGRAALLALDPAPPTIWGHWWTIMQEQLYTLRVGVRRWMETIKNLRRTQKGAHNEQDGS